MSDTTSRLSASQLAHFYDEGYLMVPDIFTAAELEPLRQEIAAVVATVADRLHAEGQITNSHADEGFNTRLAKLTQEHPEFTSNYISAIEGKAGGGHHGPEMYNVLTHPKLIDAMEAILGPEIIASSVYRIRPKIPFYGRGVVPWHQDSGYFSAHCDKSMIVTVWIPLVDATPENGCLQVLPNAHRGGISTHHTGGNANFLVIEDDDLPLPQDTAVTVPVPLGGVLIMTNHTPHCSTPNTTDIVRWSVDLRYQAADAPTNAFQAPEDYDAAASEVNIACYAPEGDFVVRSSEHPENVHGYAEYAARRHSFELAQLPYPERHWQPVAAR